MPLGARELTVMHRRQQLALRKVTVEQIAKVWPSLDYADLDASFPTFAAGVAAVVSRNRKTSSGLAVGYLRAFRVASGLSGDVRLIVPQLAAEQFTTSLRVSSLVAAKKATAAAVPAEVAMTNALTLTTGEMARLVLNGGRETVTQTIQNDPKARGWMRVLGTGGCDFCRELAGRVYPRDNADFEAHGHCGCTSEPVYA